MIKLLIVEDEMIIAEHLTMLLDEPRVRIGGQQDHVRHTRNGGCGGALPFHSGGSNFRRSAPTLTFIEFSSKLSDLPSTRRRSPVVASTHTMEVTSPCAPQPMIETSDCQGACSSATRLARLTLSVTI